MIAIILLVWFKLLAADGDLASVAPKALCASCTLTRSPRPSPAHESPPIWS
jgi:hypothetical protein